MSPTLDSQEQKHLAKAELRLDTANHCLVRQLRALSTLGSHGADLSLAEAVLNTMLRTHDLLVQDKERIEGQFRSDDDSGRARKTGSASELLPRWSLELGGESTLMLRKMKLRSKRA